MIAAASIDLDSLTGLITAIGVLAGSQGFVAWVNRRQLRSDVGDTGDTTLVDRFDSLEADVAGIKADVAVLADAVARSRLGNDVDEEGG